MIALYRIIAELPCLAGLLVAGFLAYHDKSAWIWAWFLLFAFCNIITSTSSKGTPAITSHKDASHG